MSQPNLTSDIALIERELWFKGEPLHVFHDGQIELLKTLDVLDSFLAVINCSRQFGKTFWACMLAIMYCIKHPGSNVKYGAAQYTDLSKFIYPTLRKIKDMMPVELQPEIIESKKQVIFKPINGKISIIDLCGLDLNPDGLRGPSVSLVIIEEAGYVAKIHYIYFDVVLPMFIHTQKLNPKCVMLGTPSDDLTHDFTTFFFPKAIKEGTYIIKTIDDNPMLSLEDKKRIIEEYTKDCTTPASLAIQEAKRDRELYGMVRADPSKAIIPEWDDKYINNEDSPLYIPRDEFFGFYHKYTSMDYGVSDKTVFLFYYYDFKNACVVFEGEFQDQGSQMTTDVLHAGVVSRETELYNGKIYRRVADTTNLLLINDFTVKYNMPFLHVKKDLLQVMVNEARIWVKNGRVRVHPKLFELIGCLKHGRWNDKKDAFDDSKMFGHFDALATFIYALRIIDQITNPIPITHGLGKEGKDFVVMKPNQNDAFKQKMRAAFNSKR